MLRTDALVIGAGQAGLAMSFHLGRLGIDHVVLDRGRVGERWRSERWDSLRLLTPNWMSRLPGWSYRGGDPDGFMTMAEVVAHLDGYARSFAAPVRGGTTVRSVEPAPAGYRVRTDRGDWACRAVVIATGHCDVPLVPAMARDLPGDVAQVVPSAYRNPAALPDGGVLVVGASATGVQLAEEIHASGRAVTLAAGRHIRLPRTWRGRDILWWLDRAGVLDETADAVPDLARARGQPSLQLVGRDDRRDIDLSTLRGQGVRIVGRLAGIAGGRIALCNDLADNAASAQRTLMRLLARIDASPAAADAPPAPPPKPFVPGIVPTALDLRAEGIRTVVWATGYRRDYSWLKVPVLDAAGEIVHRGGVTPAPGLCVMGLRFLRRRKSTFIDGVGADAADLADHLSAHLSAGRAAAAA